MMTQEGMLGRQTGPSSQVWPCPAHYKIKDFTDEDKMVDRDDMIP